MTFNLTHYVNLIQTYALFYEIQIFLTILQLKLSHEVSDNALAGPGSYVHSVIPYHLLYRHSSKNSR